MEALVNEITLQDIKDVQKVLKKLCKNWVALLAAAMYPGEDENSAKDKIYNLISGNSGRDQDTRSIFIFHANELKNKIQNKVDTAINSIQEIKKTA